MREKTKRHIFILISIAGIFCFEYMTVMVFRGLAFPSGGMGHSGVEYRSFFESFTPFGFFMSSRPFTRFLLDAAAWITVSISDSIFAGIVTGFITIFASYYISRLIIAKRDGFLIGLIAYITASVPMAAVFFAFLPYGIWRSVFETAAVASLYITGLKGYRSKNPYPINTRVIITGCVFAAMSLVLAYYLPALHTFRIPGLLLGYIFIACALLIRNQEQLEHRMGVGGEVTVDARNIRSYNILLVSIVFVAILLAFNIQGIIVFALKLIKTITVFIIAVIFKVINFLMSLLSGDANPGTPSSSETPITLPPGEGNTNQLLDTIAEIVFIIIMLFSLYKLAPVIYRKLKGCFMSFVGFLKRFITPNTDKTEEEYFTDIIEIVAPDGRKRRISAPVSGVLLLRRKLKRLRRSSDTTEKVRLMYGIILYFLGNKLSDKKAGIAKSDTTGEILQKAGQVLTNIDEVQERERLQAAMEKLTHAYERVRYGDAVPGNEEYEQLAYDYEHIKAVFIKDKKVDAGR